MSPAWVLQEFPGSVVSGGILASVGGDVRCLGISGSEISLSREPPASCRFVAQATTLGILGPGEDSREEAGEVSGAGAGSGPQIGVIEPTGPRKCSQACLSRSLALSSHVRREDSTSAAPTLASLTGDRWCTDAPSREALGSPLLSLPP